MSHYEILQPLGKGGMGEVFEGYDRTLKRKVALKAIRADRRLSTNARARFLREARILSQLDHPSICRIHDYVQEQDSDWLVLELIDGRSLHDALHDGLDVSVKMRVAQQVAQVLIVTHAADIIHRDLKPGNIMLTKHGDTKVLDFGLARSGDPQSGASESPAPEPSTDVDLSAVTVERPLSEPSPTERPTKFQTSARSVIGTPVYMSPEQARGEPATPSSDMYSFGLLLQKLFATQGPYGRRLGPDGSSRKSKKRRNAPARRR